VWDIREAQIISGQYIATPYKAMKLSEFCTGPWPRFHVSEAACCTIGRKAVDTCKILLYRVLFGSIVHVCAFRWRNSYHELLSGRWFCLEAQ
jgi:hypothetical protein